MTYQPQNPRRFAILWVMCAHYDPQIDPARLHTHFGVNDPPLGLKPSLWPGYFGPFIRRHEFSDVGDEAVPFRELMVGSFGLIPHWSKDTTIARRTYNARSETVHEKPSYRDAWRLARHCIIPAEAIYEPDWRSGKAIPTRITRADGEPLGIAGLWAAWKSPTGELKHSFTMLTINADSHHFMRQFHKPEDEKRMVVILNEENYDAWLRAPAAESRDFFRQFSADNLRAEQPQSSLL
ncbi:SOS response-associated peptidase [Dechloromonas sp. A34]|uniref:SOS response-associated peptidase n=1 Tax=Dechloromonas sp. A34 TaxID=447588 RepID=UPI0022496B27|nr:SOS response-associated peptidase [Dechloromonas sp. A34]